LHRFCSSQAGETCCCSPVTGSRRLFTFIFVLIFCSIPKSEPTSKTGVTRRVTVSHVTTSKTPTAPFCPVRKKSQGDQHHKKVKNTTATAFIFSLHHTHNTPDSAHHFSIVCRAAQRCALLCDGSRPVAIAANPLTICARAAPVAAWLRAGVVAIQGSSFPLLCHSGF